MCVFLFYIFRMSTILDFIKVWKIIKSYDLITFLHFNKFKTMDWNVYTYTHIMIYIYI